MAAVMKSKNLLSKAKVRIYATMVRPAETYECETWKMNCKRKGIARDMEKKFQRRFVGKKIWGRGLLEEQNQ